MSAHLCLRKGTRLAHLQIELNGALTGRRGRHRPVKGRLRAVSADGVDTPQRRGKGHWPGEGAAPGGVLTARNSEAYLGQDVPLNIHRSYGAGCCLLRRRFSARLDGELTQERDIDDAVDMACAAFPSMDDWMGRFRPLVHEIVRT